MQTESIIAETKSAFLAGLRQHPLGATEPGWLAAQRRQAMEAFVNLGFPTVRDEEWRYTNIAPISQTPFQTTQPGDDTSGELPEAWVETKTARLVFVNGSFQPERSPLAGLPAGTIVGNLKSLLANSRTADTLRVYLGRTLERDRHAFSALNSALWSDGACVIIPAGTVLKDPVHLVYFSRAGGQPVASYPRTLVVCEPDSQATIIEEYCSAGEGIAFSNSVTEVVAGENSIVDIMQTSSENSRSYHIGLLQMYVGRAAQVSAMSCTFSGAIVRNEVHALLEAEGADCTLNGLYAAKASQHVDNHTTVDHARAHGSSRQLYNGILDGHATAVFNGRVIVRPDAQKTDAIQKNRNLLLSPDATIDTKPQLEISANDVRCTHGATVGQMDQEALFFLRSRGLDRSEASSLLVQAFACEILDRVKVSSYRSWLEEQLRTKFLRGSERN